MPFCIFQTLFPEEDGFEYVMGLFHREVCYTQNEGGEEVAVRSCSRRSSSSRVRATMGAGRPGSFWTAAIRWSL
jgi:hypothetical protein